VNIEPNEFDLQAEQSREVTLQFTSPQGVNPSLLPIYSGFIYVTNKKNGDVVHLSCEYFPSIDKTISFRRCWNGW
jgi:hypothetical protein